MSLNCRNAPRPRIACSNCSPTRVGASRTANSRIISHSLISNCVGSRRNLCHSVATNFANSHSSSPVSASSSSSASRTSSAETDTPAPVSISSSGQYSSIWNSSMSTTSCNLTRMIDNLTPPPVPKQIPIHWSPL